MRGNLTACVYVLFRLYKENLPGAATLQVTVEHCSGSRRDVKVQRRWKPASGTPDLFFHSKNLPLNHFHKANIPFNCIPDKVLFISFLLYRTEVFINTALKKERNNQETPKGRKYNKHWRKYQRWRFDLKRQHVSRTVYDPILLKADPPKGFSNWFLKGN